MEQTAPRPVGRPRIHPLKPTFEVVEDAVPIPTPTISRYTLKDLIEQGSWLADRVRQNWSHLTERSALGWLRSCLEINEFFFIKSPHAVSLCRVMHLSLDPVPTVEEIFVFVDEKDKEDRQREGAAHYVEMQRWARTMQGRDIIVNRHTDVPLDMIREAMGPVAQKPSYVASTLMVVAKNGRV